MSVEDDIDRLRRFALDEKACPEVEAFCIARVCRAAEQAEEYVRYTTANALGQGLIKRAERWLAEYEGTP